MQPPGTFRIRRNAARRNTGSEPSGFDARPLDPFSHVEIGEGRTRRIVDSLCEQILDGGENLRIRQVFPEPRAVYRVELEMPEMSYQRMTLLDEDSLEELLEIDEVRSRVAQALR